MTGNEATGLLVSAVTSAYLATHSALVAGTVAAAFVLMKITDDRDQSLGHGYTAEEKRS
jgi:hypothetical protein